MRINTPVVLCCLPVIVIKNISLPVSHPHYQCLQLMSWIPKTTMPCNFKSSLAGQSWGGHDRENYSRFRPARRASADIVAWNRAPLNRAPLNNFSLSLSFSSFFLFFLFLSWILLHIFPFSECNLFFYPLSFLSSYFSFLFLIRNGRQASAPAALQGPLQAPLQALQARLQARLRARLQALQVLARFREAPLALGPWVVASPARRGYAVDLMGGPGLCWFKWRLWDGWDMNLPKIHICILYIMYTS